MPKVDRTPVKSRAFLAAVWLQKRKQEMNMSLPSIFRNRGWSGFTIKKKGVLSDH